MQSFIFNKIQKLLFIFPKKKEIKRGVILSYLYNGCNIYVFEDFFYDFVASYLVCFSKCVGGREGVGRSKDTKKKEYCLKKRESTDKSCTS